MTAAEPRQVAWLRAQIEHRYKISTVIVGEGAEYSKEAMVLNRRIVWHAGKGVTLEADRRHVEVMVEEPDRKNKKPLKVPAAKLVKEESDEDKAKDLEKKRRAGKLEKQKGWW